MALLPGPVVVPDGPVGHWAVRRAHLPRSAAAGGPLARPASEPAASDPAFELVSAVRAPHVVTHHVPSRRGDVANLVCRTLDR